MRVFVQSLVVKIVKFIVAVINFEGFILALIGSSAAFAYIHQVKANPL